MVKQSRPSDEEIQKTLAKIAHLLESLLRQVTDANMKLDHIIETYRNDRYAVSHSDHWDPFTGSYQP